jgi:hypothetical protein
VVEHLAFNQGVESSILSALTKNAMFYPTKLAVGKGQRSRQPK